jgi:hypothetical protein
MSDHYKTDGMIIRNQDGDCMGIFSAVSLLNDKINQLTSQDKTIERLEKQLEVAMEELKDRLINQLKLQEENKKLREKLDSAIKEMVVALDFMNSMGWKDYDMDETEFQCQDSLTTFVFNHHTNKEAL